MSPFLIFIVWPSQSTSGASETIFMKFFSRSSRATGPKMRVPRGLRCCVDDHGRVLVERDRGAVVAAERLLRPHDDRLHDLALLDRALRGRVLTVPTMMSPTRA